MYEWQQVTFFGGADIVGVLLTELFGRCCQDFDNFLTFFITRCDFVAYGQGIQKTLQRFLCSKNVTKSHVFLWCIECGSFANWAFCTFLTTFWYFFGNFLVFFDNFWQLVYNFLLLFFHIVWRRFKRLLNTLVTVEFVPHLSDICKRCEFFIYFVNLAAASPWLRRSWSPNYSVLVILLLRTNVRFLNFCCWIWYFS
jgi:hypothetical protein